jgi:hypothetical protein
VTYQEAITKINARLAIGATDKRWAIIINAKNRIEVQERLLVLDIQQQGGNYVVVSRPDGVEYAVDFRYNVGPMH